MKVIRDEDKKSNKYITRFEVEKGTIQKNTRKNATAVDITTEDYNNLVVYMADGSKPRYKNVPESKVRLLELRHQQFLNNKTKLKNLKNYKTFFNVIVGGIAGIIVSVTAMATSSITTLLQCSAITFALAYASATVVNKIINSKINDINKYALFFENEDIFKDVDLDNSNILERVKSKDKSVITKIKQEKDNDNDKQYFDNNSIDGLSLDALRKIKDNIERENYLALSTTQEKNKDAEFKGISYTKK